MYVNDVNVSPQAWLRQFDYAMIIYFMTHNSKKIQKAFILKKDSIHYWMFH